MKLAVSFHPVASALMIMATFFRVVDAQSCPLTGPDFSNSFGSFSSVVVALDCQDIQGNINFPTKFNWHITEVDGLDEGEILMIPPAVVSPYVSNGALKFSYSDTQSANTTKAGIQISVPIGQLTGGVLVSGNAITVAIDMASDIPISVTGNTNTVSVNSSSDFAFEFTGNSGTSEISSKSVSVEFSGNDLTSSIKGDVSGSITGNSMTLLIEGNATLTATGNSIAIKVNGGGCNGVESTGNDITCETTTETVTVTELPCFASTGLSPITCKSSGVVVSVSAWVVALAICVM